MRICCCGASLRLMRFSCDLSIVRSLLAVACHCNCTKSVVRWERRLVRTLEQAFGSFAFHVFL